MQARISNSDECIISYELTLADGITVVPNNVSLLNNKMRIELNANSPASRLEIKMTAFYNVGM